MWEQFLLNSVAASAAYALIAVGFNLIYGATKFVNMAHGAVAVFAGYVVFSLSRSFGIDPWVASAIGVLAAGVLGWLSDILVYRRLRQHRASNLVLFIASLGIFTVIQSILAVIFGSQLVSLFRGGEAAEAVAIGNGFLSSIQILIILVWVISFAGLVILLYRSAFGRAVRAVSDDEEVAKIIGLRTDRIIGQIFFIGSVLAGAAGILKGFDTGVDPGSGLGMVLEGAIASIIGGIGNVYGGVLGAVLLGFSENIGIIFIPAEWRWVITFGILIPFLIWRPQGILNK